MPCLMDPNEKEEVRSRKLKEAKKVEAILCGVLTIIEGGSENIWHRLNYEEMGVSRVEAEKWWDDHKAKDKARREREEQEAKKEESRKSGIAKLTIAELSALGL